MTLLLALAWNTHAAPVCGVADTATYTVTFDAEWSAANHPEDFPANPHFSGLVGGTHDGSGVLWAPGQLASPGIELMAETGLKGDLLDEVRAAIAAGAAEHTLSGNGIGLSPDSVALTFEVSQRYPLVSLVSMIAPSPDWFVGVSGLPLFDGIDWVDSVSVTLVPWDAGTDDGATYDAANVEANPHQPITEITDYPFHGVPIGTFTFVRQPAAEPCLELCVDNIVAGDTATLSVSGAAPGAQVAVLYGTRDGGFTRDGGNWCVDFAFDVPSPSARLVGTGVVQPDGTLSLDQSLPMAAAGRDVQFQAAQAGTCPQTCMSGVVRATVE